MLAHTVWFTIVFIFKRSNGITWYFVTLLKMSTVVHAVRENKVDDSLFYTAVEPCLTDHFGP